MTVFAVGLALGWVLVIAFAVCLCHAAADAPTAMLAGGEADVGDKAPARNTLDAIATGWLPDPSGPVLAAALPAPD
jgi:hypothetical protein